VVIKGRAMPGLAALVIAALGPRRLTSGIRSGNAVNTVFDRTLLRDYCACGRPDHACHNRDAAPGAVFSTHFVSWGNNPFGPTSSMPLSRGLRHQLPGHALLIQRRAGSSCSYYCCHVSIVSVMV
jgi:hypothetical protein